MFSFPINIDFILLFVAMLFFPSKTKTNVRGSGVKGIFKKCEVLIAIFFKCHEICDCFYDSIFLYLYGNSLFHCAVSFLLIRVQKKSDKYTWNRLYNKTENTEIRQKIIKKEKNSIRHQITLDSILESLTEVNLSSFCFKSLF